MIICNHFLEHVSARLRDADCTNLEEITAEGPEVVDYGLWPGRLLTAEVARPVDRSRRSIPG